GDRRPIAGGAHHHSRGTHSLDTATVEDVRASDPVQRLLEESWESRSERAGRRELISELGAALAFLAVAVPLAVRPIADGRLPTMAALLLVVLYAFVSRVARFPFGAGYVTPSYLVLV